MEWLKALNELSSIDEAVRMVVSNVKAMRPYYDWVGVYLLTEPGVLTLAEDHYLGLPTEHTRIPLDSGICGASAAGKETLVIDDVKSDPRYISCSISVQSEIVVPILLGETVIGVLDLDSDTPAAFTSEDRQELEAVAATLAAIWEREQG